LSSPSLAIDRAGVEGAFIMIFVSPIATYNDNPRYDLNMASYSLVKSYANGKNGTTYPDMLCEPKRWLITMLNQRNYCISSPSGSFCTNERTSGAALKPFTGVPMISKSKSVADAGSDTVMSKYGTFSDSDIASAKRLVFPVLER